MVMFDVRLEVARVDPSTASMLKVIRSVLATTTAGPEYSTKMFVVFASPAFVNVMLVPATSENAEDVVDWSVVFVAEYEWTMAGLKIALMV